MTGQSAQHFHQHRQLEGRRSSVLQAGLKKDLDFRLVKNQHQLTERSITLGQKQHFNTLRKCLDGGFKLGILLCQRISNFNFISSFGCNEGFLKCLINKCGNQNLKESKFVQITPQNLSFK